MRKLLVVLILPLFSVATEIPPGTHVLLQMVNSINTRTAQPGDQVYMRTASPIAVDGRIVVPINSYVQGVVTHSQRPGRVKGKAQLAIRLESLTLPQGRSLKFSPKLDSVDASGSGQRVEKSEGTVEQGATTGKDAQTIAILAGSGASVGAIVERSWKGAGIGAGVGAGVGLATVMMTRGREVELRPGMSLDVVLDRPVLLQR